MGQEKMSKTVTTDPPGVTVGIDISKQALEVHVHPDRHLELKSVGRDEGGRHPVPRGTEVLRP